MIAFQGIPLGGVGGPEKDLFAFGSEKNQVLCSLPTNMVHQLDIFGHNGDSLSVNGTQVRVLEQSNEISLCCLLQCQDHPASKTEVRVKVLSNFPHQPLKWELPD